MAEPIAAPSSPPAPESTAPRARWLDALLAGLVLLFAFAAASFPVRNSDFWMHLAAGRLLANGDYQFGHDPFAYTTENIYWANHSWLFDLALYAGYQSLGGPALVIAKGLCVLVLVGLMLRIARSDGPFWISGVSTLLAVLAMSPGLLMQPIVLSLLLLAVCLYLIVKGGRAPYALPIVIAFWVNIDGWFILGPLLVILCMVGQRLGRPKSESERLPLWMLPACLIACLCSPHHFHALTLPAELSPAVWKSGLDNDARFAAFFAHPWRLSPLGPSGGYNLSMWASFALLILSLLSFVVNGGAVRGWRLPVWLAFAGLAAWQVRLIPFFAVVAGPIMALNLRERLAGRARLPLLGRITLLLMSLALLVLAWPGWLQGFDRRDRPLAWEVQPDLGLQKAAERRAGWRQSGLLDDSDRAFHVHPDSANYSVWFCPKERVFFDRRLKLFTHVAGEYLNLSQASGFPAKAQGQFPGEASTILRERQITYIVMHDPNLASLQAALRQFWKQAAETPLILLEGREATFGRRRASRSALPFERWRLDLDALAFVSPEKEDRIPGVAPEVGVGREPRAANFWNEFLYPSRPRPFEADTAALLLGYVEEQITAGAQAALSQRIAIYTAGLVGVMPHDGGPFSMAWPVGLRIEFGQLFLPPVDAVSPSASLLAIRAARRAVAANPDVADGWLRLGQAYLALTYSTRENLWADSCRPLAQLRHIQAACALERAALLDPDREETRALLTQLYSLRRMLDAAVHHLREQVRIVRERRSPDDTRRVEELAKRLEGYEAILQDRRAEFTIRSRGLRSDPLAQARIALGLSLSRTALDDVLLPSEVVQFGIPGARLMLELLLMLGRPDAARRQLEGPEVKQHRERLGLETVPATGRPDRPPFYALPAYTWWRFLLAAADGEYEHAEIELSQLMQQADQERRARTRRAELSLPLFVATEIGLSARPDTRTIANLLGHELQAVFVYRTLNRYDLQVQADLRTMAGALALERGFIDEATKHFRAALQLAASPEVRGLGFSLEPMCRAYLARLANARN